MAQHTPSKNFPYKQWCAAKSITPKHGYKLIENGLLETFVVGNRRYVSEEEDLRFDAATRCNTAVEPIAHAPETYRKGVAQG